MVVALCVQTEFVGAGFMIGSAFAVVLPEGFEALYSGVKMATHSHGHSHGHDDASEHHAHVRLLRATPTPSVRATLDEMFEGHDDVLTRRTEAPGGHQELELPCPRWAPGGALLAGFLAMMIFEFVHHHWEGAHGHSHASGHGCSHSHFPVRAWLCPVQAREGSGPACAMFVASLVHTSHHVATSPSPQHGYAGT